MARVLQGSHSFICTPRVYIRYRNEPYLPLPSQPKLVLIYRPRRDRKLSWPCVVGWLRTEISVPHRELNPDTVAHLSSNRIRRRLTSSIEANALTTTPDHQTTYSSRYGVTYTTDTFPHRSCSFENDPLLYRKPVE